MSLPSHCVPTSPFLESVSIYFSTCLPTPLTFFSYTCGLLSIISWLFAQLPQIIKNYQRKSVDGLSLGFLAIWLAGDVGNMLGAMWTRQMMFQQIVGTYYVFVDVVLVSQWMWYYGQKPLQVVDAVAIGSSGDESDEVGKGKSTSGRKARRNGGPSKSIATSVLVAISMMFHLAGATPISAHTAPESTDYELLGRYLSWTSTICYLLSRLPQIYLNFRRRNTSGLAITLFIAAFFGNVFYSLSLLLSPLGHRDYPPYGGGGIAGPEGSEAEEWWSRSLPFFLGAFGVLVMDFLVFMQWIWWGEGEKQEKLAKEPVRGWWPWNGWWKGATDDEVEGLLTNHQHGTQRGESSRRPYGTS
ncbi:hypothetical protein EX30DRAFT_344798 [Ascodesmis nigricans]|uniref:PQ-loop-domain-containing protein n=1 Tax=Ascodesmis nigricans TaxID=341454 RepID=A0A4S2MI22_9PEZI|nr:hypothetical protein EX30DRAFT_344798 [Ascodesmis nigricans]